PEIVVELRKVIEGVAEPDEARPDRAQVGGFERERFEEVLDLPDRFAGWLVRDGFAGEPAAAGLKGAVSDFQDRPPRSLAGDRPSSATDDWLQPANRRRGAFSRDPHDEPCEGIEPWIEHGNARELEDAAECRQRQDTFGIIESSPHPLGRAS